MISSHTGTGGLWTDDDLRRLLAPGGYATARLDSAETLPDAILRYRKFRSVNRCRGVALSTDTGGFAALPGPGKLAYPFRPYRGRLVFGRQQTGSRSFDLSSGVAHYGLIPDLLAQVQTEERGREALGMLLHAAEAYLETWERAERIR